VLDILQQEGEPAPRSHLHARPAGRAALAGDGRGTQGPHQDRR
jgi:hypothetical protein